MRTNSNIQVSIIIPCYNASQYLPNTFKLLTNLNGGGKSEIIFINDGSTDETFSIIAAEVAKHENWRYASINNSGPSTARNVGLSMAHGEWILFYDADDFLHTDALKIAYAKAIESDCDALQFRYQAINEDGSRSWERNGTKRAGTYDKEKILKVILPHFIGYSVQKVSEYGKLSFNEDVELCSVWRFLYRRSFLEKYNLRFDPRINNGEDRMFNCIAMVYARKVRIVDDVLYTYITKAGGTMYTNLHDSERLISNKINTAIIRNEIRERCIMENGVDIQNTYSGSMFFSVLEICKSLGNIAIKKSYPKVISYLETPLVMESIKQIPIKGSVQIKLLLLMVKSRMIWPLLLIFRILNLRNKIYDAKHTHQRLRLLARHGE